MGKIRNSVSTRWRQVHAPKNKCRISRTWKVIRAGVEQSVKRLLKVQIAQKAGRTFVILNRKRSDWSWILFGEGQRNARSWLLENIIVHKLEATLRRTGLG